MNRHLRVVVFFIVCSFTAVGQSVDLETLGKRKLLKVGGNINANAVFSNSSQGQVREPLTWVTNGSLNVSVLGFTVPITFNYSNRGSQLDYALPFDINQLSLHPSYKWITAHIGTVSMNFSPNTLNGHQFTGAGIDLSPSGPFKISAMYGRLLKATIDDGNEQTIPSFERIGYGAKASYKKNRFKTTLIGFYAKDNPNSIAPPPEDRNITPKENLAISIGVEVELTDNLGLEAEYSSTAITEDIRSEKESLGSKPFVGLFFPSRSTTEFYDAVNISLNYQIGKINFGVGYERIDPDYKTLGSYYFNNDFENITFYASRPFFQDKLNVAFDVGVQRNDIDNTQSVATQKFVGSVNANYTPVERLTISGSFSNFQNFTNIKFDQFETINDNNSLNNNLDSLNFRQISRTLTLDVGYIVKEDEKSNHNLTFNYSVNDVANQENGIVRIGNASTFYNFSSGYTIDYPESDFNISALANYTINTIGRENSTTWGPSLNAGKRFFDGMLGTNFGASYNSGKNKESTSSVVNLTINSSYSLKEKHNFNLGATNSFRSVNQLESVSELTVTFGYSYSFDLKRKKRKRKKKKAKERVISVSFDDRKIEGTSEEIKGRASEIISERNLQIPNEMERKLKIQLNELKRLVFVGDSLLNREYSEKKRSFKKAVWAASETFAKAKKFDHEYRTILWTSVLNLKNKENRLVYEGGKDLDNQYVLEFRTLKKMIPDEFILSDNLDKYKQLIKNKSDIKKEEYSVGYMIRALDRINDEETFLKSPIYQDLKNLLIKAYSDNLENDQVLTKKIIINRIIYYYYNKLSV